MADEFKHLSAGTSLTQGEYEAVGGHVLACQATGDIVYASSGSQLSRLGKGAANTILAMGGSCIPAWTASPSVTDLTIGGGCITLSAATDIDLLDNNASALSFDASGKTGIIDIVTTNCSEGVTMSGTLGVTGVLTATGGLAGGAICIGSSTITTTGLISGGSLDIDDVLINGTTIGHTCDTDLLTIGNASLTAKGTVTVGVDDTGHDVTFFGAAAGAFMLWDEGSNLLDIRGATAAGPGHLKLTTGETTVVACDVLGRIDFQAPLEADCSADARLVGATIAAVAQGTFSNTVNSTDLLFYTGHSETAAEKIRFTSQGEIGIGGANYGTDGQVLTSAGAGAAVAWEDAGGGVGCGPLRISAGSAGAPAYSFCGDTNNGIFAPAGDSLAVTSSGVERWRISGTLMAFGDTTNGNMDEGFTINQAAADNEILALKSSDVGHGMTGQTETDTYGKFWKLNAGGGLIVDGYKDCSGSAFGALWLRGSLGEEVITTKSCQGYAVVHIDARVKCSVNAGAPGADGNLVSIGSNTAVRFIFDQEGTAHAEVGTATYDDYCDVEVLRGLLAETVPCYKETYQERFGKDLMYSLPWYEENKLIGKDSIHWEERACGRMQQKAMINFTGLTMLHHSTIIQLADRVDARLTALETQIALQGGK